MAHHALVDLVCAWRCACVLCCSLVIHMYFTMLSCHVTQKRTREDICPLCSGSKVGHTCKFMLLHVCVLSFAATSLHRKMSWQ